MTRNIAKFRVWDPKAEEYVTVDIAREKVIEAFQWYDREYPGNSYKPQGKTPWTEVKSYHWAVWYKGNFYPPKLILRHIIGDDKGFWGGDKSGQANTVYRILGFEVTTKPGIS